MTGHCRDCKDGELCSRHAHYEDGPDRPTERELDEYKEAGWNLPLDYPPGE